MRKRSWRREGAAWGLVCLFVILMGALTFAPLRTADSPLGIALPYDTGDYYSPLTFFSDYWVKHGDFPEWNGFYLCGMPLAANPQALLFYPPNMLRRLAVDGLHPRQTVYSMLAMVAVHIVIAGLGAFALARSHGLGRTAALVTTVAFVFSAGFVIRCTMHWVFPTTLAWVPWMWLALRKIAFAHSLKSASYWAVAAGVFTGLCLLAGFPQLAYFAMLGGGIYFVVLATKQIFGHRERLREVVAGRYALAIFLIGVVSFSAAAMLLLPGLELMRHSSRSIGSAVEIQFPSAQEPVEPTSVLSQLILYSGTKNTEDPRLCGIGVWLFALLSLFWRKRRDVVACGLAFAFLLLCAVNSDGIFGKLINATTPFEWRHPERLTLLVCLPLGLLAGMGFQACARPAASSRQRLLRSVVLMAAAVGMLAVVSRFVHPHPYLNVGWEVLAIPALLSAGLLVTLWNRAPRAVMVVFLALLIAEAWVWNRHLVPYQVTAGLDGYDNALHTNAVPSPPLSNRRLTGWGSLGLFSLTPVIGGYEPLLLSSTRALLSAPGEEEIYRRVAGTKNDPRNNLYYNVFLKRPFWLSRQYVEGPLPGKHVPFPSATTVFLKDDSPSAVPRVDRAVVEGTFLSNNTQRIDLPAPELEISPAADHPQTPIAYRFPPIRLPSRHAVLVIRCSAKGAVQLDTWMNERDTAAPFVAPSAVVSDTQSQTLEIPLPDLGEVDLFILGTPRDRSSTLMLHEVYLKTDLDDENESIQMLSRSADAIEVEVRNLAGPRILSFIDVDYPGWRAWVNDRPAPILRANDLFKAVEVPAGTSRVRFEFHSPSVKTGVWISTGGWLVALLLLAAPGIQKLRR